MGHTKPTKAQLLTYKHTPIVYGTSKQFTDDTDTSAPLDAKGILRVQLFPVRYYIMVALSTTN